MYPMSRLARITLILSHNECYKLIVVQLGSFFVSIQFISEIFKFNFSEQGDLKMLIGIKN